MIRFVVEISGEAAEMLRSVSNGGDPGVWVALELGLGIREEARRAGHPDPASLTDTVGVWRVDEVVA